jgi:uncharacterized membrane protein YbaN (DUF454 family)
MLTSLDARLTKQVVIVFEESRGCSRKTKFLEYLIWELEVRFECWVIWWFAVKVGNEIEQIKIVYFWVSLAKCDYFY